MKELLILITGPTTPPYTGSSLASQYFWSSTSTTFWNTVSVGVCEKLGSKADGGHKYRASKVLAEKAFWKFFEDEKPKFDGAAIHPVMTYGPITHQCDSPESLNDSINRRIWPFVSGKRTQKDLPEPGSSFVDIRDVALVHVRAMSVPEASGESFLASSERYSGNDVCVILNKEFTQLPSVPKGDDSPGVRERINDVANFMDSAKSQKMLGIKYRPIEEVVRDTTQSLIDRFNIIAN